MKLTKTQFLTLSDVCREAATVVLGGLIIGGIFAQHSNVALLATGLFLYPLLVALALFFKKKGD